MSFFSKLFETKSRSDLIAEYENADEKILDEEYRALGRQIWKNYVPNSGQSLCIQGELLRAIEKLRDEAHRNGNVNWDFGHEILAKFILDTLLDKKDISENSKVILKTDIKRILKFEVPYLEDDLFDRIGHIILDWCRLHKNPIPRDINPNLHR
jgi:hypothetical protein